MPCDNFCRSYYHRTIVLSLKDAFQESHDMFSKCTSTVERTISA